MGILCIRPLHWTTSLWSWNTLLRRCTVADDSQLYFHADPTAVDNKVSSSWLVLRSATGWVLTAWNWTLIKPSSLVHLLRHPPPAVQVCLRHHYSRRHCDPGVNRSYVSWCTTWQRTDLCTACPPFVRQKFLANVNVRYMLSPVRLSSVCLSVVCL